MIFKFYYQHDNKKTWRTSTGRNEGTNVSVSTTLLSKDKKLPRVSRSTTTIPNEAFLEKKQQQEQWRRAEEGTSEEQPKDMIKYKKDLNDTFIVFCQFAFFLACCFLKNGITLFKELTLLIIRVKPDVGRIHEQQQKKTRLDQGKIFIIRNTHTHGNLTRIGRTCQTLGKERHNIELILWESISITNLSSNEWIWKTCLLHWTSWRLPAPEKRRTTKERGREK